jgi:NTE family protein
MEMGYRDAWHYLDGADPEGVPKDSECTAMRVPPRGMRYRERLRGELDGADLVLEAAVDLPLPDDGAPSPGARLVGHIDHDPWGGRVLLADGRAEADGSALTYTARVRLAGRWHRVRVRRAPADAKVAALWTRTGPVPFRIADGKDVRLELGLRDAAHALASVTPFGTHGIRDRADTVTELADTPLRRTVTGAQGRPRGR